MYNLKTFDEVFAIESVREVQLFGKIYTLLLIYFNLMYDFLSIFFSYTDVFGNIVYVYEPRMKDINGSKRPIVDVVLEDTE